MKKIYILSILMALVVGMSVYFFADSIKKTALEKNEIQRSGVVVAINFIPVNTAITADMVKQTDLPIEGINPMAARKLDDVIGSITQYPIEAEEQIFTTRVKKRGEGAEGRLSYILSTGQRAVTVAVDEFKGVAGNITKGDYVDVVANMVNAENNDKNATSFFVVQNLLVLDTGKKVIESAEATNQEYVSVTLSASPEDVIKINYAATGDIRLVLRPVLDNEITAETYYPTVFPAEAAVG